MLANDGHDTRAIQHYLGHRSIASTVRYTALAPDRRILEVLATAPAGPVHPSNQPAGAGRREIGVAPLSILANECV
jgi:hypothetical protein